MPNIILTNRPQAKPVTVPGNLVDRPTKYSKSKGLVYGTPLARLKARFKSILPGRSYSSLMEKALQKTTSKIIKQEDHKALDDRQSTTGSRSDKKLNQLRTTLREAIKGDMGEHLYATIDDLPTSKKGNIEDKANIYEEIDNTYDEGFSLRKPSDIADIMVENKLYGSAGPPKDDGTYDEGFSLRKTPDIGDVAIENELYESSGVSSNDNDYDQTHLYEEPDKLLKADDKGAAMVESEPSGSKVSNSSSKAASPSEDENPYEDVDLPASPASKAPKPKLKPKPRTLTKGK